MIDLDPLVEESAEFLRGAGAHPDGANPGFAADWPAIRSALEALHGHLPFWAKWLCEVLLAMGERATR